MTRSLKATPLTALWISQLAFHISLPCYWSTLRLLLILYLCKLQPRNAYVIRQVRTGAELVNAWEDNIVTHIDVLEDIAVSEADFNTSSPVLLNRSVTVESDVASAGTFGYILNFNFLQRKVTLGPGTTLTLRNVIIMNFRAGTLSASPGLDILTPTQHVPDAPPSMVIIQDAMVLLRWCYPASTQDENIR
ncbi:hypothetical protein Agub_g4796, partial [Astrephomene gubernaculifera]